MISAFKLSGVFAAHAVWCVSDGETLIPLLAYSTADGSRQMNRLTDDDDFAKAVEFGRGKLDSNEMQASDAVLLYDAVIPVNEVPTDAIIVEIRTYSALQARAIMVIPYTPKSVGEFRVHKPKLVRWKNCEDFDMQAALDAFFQGVDEHEMGAKVWNDCLDESK